MDIKGLTYIPKPLEGIASRTAPRGHQEIVAEIAALYRQESRLEKKLLLWKRNQQQAERDIRRQQKRRVSLQRILERRAGTERKSGDDGGRKAPTRRKIPPPSPQPAAPQTQRESQPEPEPAPWERQQPPIALERQQLRRRTTR